MKSRILFIGLSSIVLLFYYATESRACFPYPLETLECRFNLFVPYSAHLRTFDGMYFSYHPMHDAMNEKGVEADRQINVGEWYEYIKHKADRNAIYHLLYNMEPTVFLAAVAGEGGHDSASRNSFLRYLIRPENKKILAYMTVAKSGEHYTRWDPVDPWENDYNAPPHLAYLQEPIANALDSAHLDDFLRARYLYLDIRFSSQWSYAGDTIPFRGLSVRSDYEALQRIPIHTVVKGWAAYFNAITVMRHDTAYGNYLLAQAFNMSNDKKAPIYRHFSVDLFGESSRYVHNNRELANLHALVAMKWSGDVVDMIEKVYHLDPANPNLHILMTREISKLEDRIYTPRYTDLPAQVIPGYSIYGDNYHTADFGGMARSFLFKWKGFMVKALADSLPKDKFFFNLCMAHTCLLDQKPEEAKAYLAEAKKYTPADPELLYQFRLTEVAAMIESAPALDSSFESDITPSLRWLDRNKDHLENGEMALRQLHLMLSQRYENAGNGPRAILTRARYNWFAEYKTVASGYYFDLDTSLYLYIQERATGADAESFLRTVTAKVKTPFEKYYADVVKADTAEFNAAYDAAGSNYLREANWVSALRMFSQIPDSYWADDYRSSKMLTYLNADPFTAHPFDNHAHSHSLDSTQRYTKKAFTRHLVKLLNNDINTPDSLLKIADAMYNMTYFGNSWILVRNAWSAFDNVFDRENWGARNILSPRYYDYYACRRARQWYQRAYDASRDKEVKARAMLMTAQCDKNFSYLLTQGKRPGSRSLFDRFTKTYADTRYYADLTSTCDISDVRKQFFYFIP